MTGLILRDPPGVVLRTDDGGHWRLDGVDRVEEFVGRKLRVAGVRSAFDRLEVDSIDGESIPRGERLLAADLGLVAVLVGLALVSALYAGG